MRYQILVEMYQNRRLYLLEISWNVRSFEKKLVESFELMYSVNINDDSYIATMCISSSFY